MVVMRCLVLFVRIELVKKRKFGGEHLLVKVVEIVVWNSLFQVVGLEGFVHV